MTSVVLIGIPLSELNDYLHAPPGGSVIKIVTSNTVYANNAMLQNGCDVLVIPAASQDELGQASVENTMTFLDKLAHEARFPRVVIVITDHTITAGTFQWFQGVDHEIYEFPALLLSAHPEQLVTIICRYL